MTTYGTTVETLSDRKVSLAGGEDPDRGGRVPDVVVAERLKLTYDADDDRPDCTAVVEVRDGVARVVELSFLARLDGDPIRDKDLQQVSVHGIVREALSLAAYEVVARTEEGTQLRSLFAARRQVPTAAGARGGKSDAYLSRVAEVCRKAPRADRRPKAVMDALAVSRSTARRHIAEAERRGLLR